MLGDAHRLLAGHGVDHEKDVVGLHRLPHPAQFVHQRLVDREAAGGVEDDHVLAQPGGFVAGVAGDEDGVGRFAVDRHADLFAEHLELVDGGGPLEVDATSSGCSWLFSSGPAC